MVRRQEFWIRRHRPTSLTCWGTVTRGSLHGPARGESAPCVSPDTATIREALRGCQILLSFDDSSCSHLCGSCADRSFPYAVRLKIRWTGDSISCGDWGTLRRKPFCAFCARPQVFQSRRADEGSCIVCTWSLHCLSMSEGVWGRDTGTLAYFLWELNEKSHNHTNSPPKLKVKAQRP